MMRKSSCEDGVCTPISSSCCTSSAAEGVEESYSYESWRYRVLSTSIANMRWIRFYCIGVTSYL